MAHVRVGSKLFATEHVAAVERFVWEGAMHETVIVSLAGGGRLTFKKEEARAVIDFFAGRHSGTPTRVDFVGTVVDLAPEPAPPAFPVLEGYGRG